MVFEKIKLILCEEFEIDDNDISLDAVLTIDLGLGDIDLIDLVMSIEDEFNVELPDEALEALKKVVANVNSL
jgi:acyl carrier protein